jgi:D-xylose transport system substrate-binding protein
MKIISTLFAASTLVLVAANGALAAGKPVIGVSWSNFQEERWKTDEAAIKAAIEKAGGTYISADAQSSPGKQLTDIESLITKGANALIVLAQDSDAIRPAIEKANQEGIPVVGYDRLIEIPSAFYITFDVPCWRPSPRAITPSSRALRPIRTPTSSSPARWRF